MRSVELREAGGKVLLSFYPSVTESWYDMGEYEEIVRGGAFRQTLGESPDVALLLEHRGLALASTRPVSGASTSTLSLAEDQTGLRGDAELSPDDPDVRLLKAKAEQAPLEASFAFVIRRQAWDEEYTKREILNVSLHRGDVAIVGRAASPATQGLANVRGSGTLEQRKHRAELLGNRFVGVSELLREPVEVRRATRTRATRPLAPSSTSIARARRAALMSGIQRTTQK
jgi:HK97 family phage prohead protease